jgi:uroporphyrinogen-III synthase
VKPAASAANARPLAGKRVLVGRAREQAGALASELRGQGASVLEVPFIQINPPKSYRALDRALESLGEYDWLVLTSVNGVRALIDRMEKLGVDHLQLRSLKLAAIGPATRAAIEKHGLEVEVMPKEYVAESVVRSLRPRVKGRRVLLVRAKIARDVIPRELRAAGAKVDVAEAYETVVPESSARRIRAAFRSAGSAPDIVTFTSSSTVRNFVALLGREPQRMLKDGVRLVSIGPVTSATMRELGLPVHIEAREYTIPGLVAAIVEAGSVAPKPRGQRRS